jgi:1-acyl-sn-glycerol-3-phosphate acyltransferase
MLVKPLMVAMEKPTWRGMEHLPKSGPVIVVANHLSHADPFTLAHFVYDSGRWPVYLAKASLFKLPVLGKWLSLVEQTPVARGTIDAAKALDAAVAALEAGKCVLIYPEGSTTKQPELWPMRGKTGAARLWLATGAPVIPIAMWGPQRIFDPRTHRLHPVPRTPVTVVAGPPVDLSKWDGAPATTATLGEITEYLMLVLRDMVAQLRGGTPPPLWQPRVKDDSAKSSTLDPSATSAPSSTSEV